MATNRELLGRAILERLGANSPQPGGPQPNQAQGLDLSDVDFDEIEVEEGDTPSRLAQRNGVTIREFFMANPEIARRDPTQGLLEAGETVRVPRERLSDVQQQESDEEVVVEGSDESPPESSLPEGDGSEQRDQDEPEQDLTDLAQEARDVPDVTFEDINPNPDTNNLDSRDIVLPERIKRVDRAFNKKFRQEVQKEGTEFPAFDEFLRDVIQSKNNVEAEEKTNSFLDGLARGFAAATAPDFFFKQQELFQRKQEIEQKQAQRRQELTLEALQQRRQNRLKRLEAEGEVFNSWLENIPEGDKPADHIDNLEERWKNRFGEPLPQQERRMAETQPGEAIKGVSLAKQIEEFTDAWWANTARTSSDPEEFKKRITKQSIATFGEKKGKRLARLMTGNITQEQLDQIAGRDEDEDEEGQTLSQKAFAKATETRLRSALTGAGENKDLGDLRATKNNIKWAREQINSGKISPPAPDWEEQLDQNLKEVNEEIATIQAEEAQEDVTESEVRERRQNIETAVRQTSVRLFQNSNINIDELPGEFRDIQDFSEAVLFPNPGSMSTFLNNANSLEDLDRREMAVQEVEQIRARNNTRNFIGSQEDLISRGIDTITGIFGGEDEPTPDEIPQSSKYYSNNYTLIKLAERMTTQQGRSRQADITEYLAQVTKEDMSFGSTVVQELITNRISELMAFDAEYQNLNQRQRNQLASEIVSNMTSFNPNNPRESIQNIEDQSFQSAFGEQ